MYLISKLFTSFFLPPGIFILALFGAAIWARKKKLLLFILALFFYAISIKPISNYLIAPLEAYEYKDNITPKAVVVLGGGTNEYDVIKSYPHTFKRLIYGEIVAKKKNLPLVYSGGGLDKVKEATNVEADLKMINKTFNIYLTTYFEKESLNTAQNAIFTARLFEDKRLKKDIYLVTSAYHMKRAVLEFKNAGFKVISKSVDFYFEEPKNFYDYIPSIRSFEASYRALHEYIGIAFFYLKNLNF
ncbi:MAG: YdcF family protein [Epsilonproteobacteria bacterium]|nr:YdcF family protein [Campylobacterota bacterium]